MIVKKLTRYRIFLSFIFFIAFPWFAKSGLCQTNRISFFRNTFYKASTEKEKLDAAIAICGESHSISPDTLYYYTQFAQRSAINSGDQPKQILANVFTETFLSRKNLFDSALTLCVADLKRLDYKHNGDGYSKTKMQQCYALMKSNRNKEALDQGYHFLAEAQKQGDTASQIFTQCIIGTVYRNMQQTEPALAWFNKANTTATDTVYEKIRNEFGLYFDLGLMYNWKMDLDNQITDTRSDSVTCIAFLDRAIRDSRRFENLGMLARALNIKAATIGNREHLREEGEYVGEAEAIYTQLHDTLSMLNSIAPRAFYYIDAEQPEKGVAVCQKGIAIAASGLGYPVLDLYETLSQCYKAAGNDKKYAETLHTMLRLKDSVYRINSERDLAELNARYEDQQKQNIIISQKLDIASKRNTMLVISIVAVLLVITILFLYFYFDRKQKTQKLKQAFAIAAAEEAERKRISADLHDNIGAYAAAAASTIATIKPEDPGGARKLSLLNHHVQDMITQLNDSIWALNKKEVRLTSISDRFKVFAQKLSQAYPNINISIDEDISVDRILSPFHALHLYRIMQEALNNALRHSRCSEIGINIMSDPGKMQVSIADNGVGMESENPNGNGINNLKTRAKESGWKVSWISNPQGGVTIMLSTEQNPTTN
jgi:signal transduction histidine kinase